MAGDRRFGLEMNGVFVCGFEGRHRLSNDGRLSRVSCGGGWGVRVLV